MALTVTASAPRPRCSSKPPAGPARWPTNWSATSPWAGDEPRARFAEQSVESDQVHLLATAMPFDVVIGSCNPVALPLTVEFDPPKAVGLATFTAPYEGAPGCVHGAVLAGAFDIMLTAANVIADGAGPTVNLSIRYRKPTLIAQPALFEAWVTEQTDRRTHSRGQLIQGGRDRGGERGVRQHGPDADRWPCTAGDQPRHGGEGQAPEGDEALGRHVEWPTTPNRGQIL